MSKTWKDRLVSCLINILIVVIAGLIIMASQGQYDDSVSIKEKVHEHDITLKEHEVKIQDMNKNLDDKFDLILEEVRINRQTIREGR